MPQETFTDWDGRVWTREEFINDPTNQRVVEDVLLYFYKKTPYPPDHNSLVMTRVSTLICSNLPSEWIEALKAPVYAKHNFPTPSWAQPRPQL